MDNWNGMTEPLGIGDAVRIVKANTSDHLGIVTKVIDIAEPGRQVHILRTNTHKKLESPAYVVEEPPGHAYARTCLYKLPPDFFDVLKEGAGEDRKRLQKTDS